MEGLRIHVKGRVQGVGFRPFVWRLARDAGLRGHVLNDGAGVRIEVWGHRADLDRFQHHLTQAPPPLARITEVTSTDLTGSAARNGFAITDSLGGEVATEITPDAATCPACRAEIFDPGNRRFGYPFTNCTHCGPRLSIVQGVPYDRAQTAMQAFTMCDDCQAEYDNPADRRFHAQPNACPVCGPKLWLEDTHGQQESADPVADLAQRLMQGQIAAIKGIGGFHLACDATHAQTVQTLRQRKSRVAKPFALMARDIAQIMQFCQVSDAEADLLSSPMAPIVLLDRLEKTALSGIAPGLAQIGVMLPHSPLHHLLMAQVDRPLVMTSGNPSQMPQVTDNDTARATLSGIADVWVMHDRDIVNRLDDSLMRLDPTGPSILRAGRGVSPAQVALPAAFAGTPPVLAMGAELKSTFCLIKDAQAIPSAHVGDLTTAETYADFQSKIALFQALYDVTPAVIAVDLHPDYLSARHGRQIADETGAQLVAVQHHHAHMASCLAEHGVAPEEARSVGVILDGAGLGTDGTIWGGEILLGDYRGFERKAHFLPVALPGGDQAAREPWRNLVAHLQAAFGADWQSQIAGTPLVDMLAAQPVDLTTQMIRQGVNTRLASSAGRLFDAVAAALGIAFTRQNYEGQAAMELEALIDHSATSGGYPAALCPDGVISWGPLWADLLADLRSGIAHSIIAARFHIGLAKVLADTAAHIAQEANTKRIVLSGGVMQNRVLQTHLGADLRARGFNVLLHSKLPANDGGISLGQACIAALTRA